MRTTFVTAMATLAIGATGALLAQAVRAHGQPHARGAHAISGNAEAHLHYIRSSGSTLYEEGPVTGSLAGHMRAVLHVEGSFSGSFTFYTRNGQIRGHGSAHLHSSGNGVESFAGTDAVTGGTGRYAHAHGNGHMYGTFNRRNYSVVVQTRGTLSY